MAERNTEQSAERNRRSLGLVSFFGPASIALLTLALLPHPAAATPPGGEPHVTRLSQNAGTAANASTEAVIVSNPGGGRSALTERRLQPRSAPSEDAAANRTTGPFGSGRPDSPATDRGSSSTPVITVVSSLAVVLGLFAALVWISRKGGRGSGSGRLLPDDALRVLGHKPLGQGGSILLVRCGHGLLVVGVSPTGMYPLANVTDDHEVRHLVGLCEGGRLTEATEAWRELRADPAARQAPAEQRERPAARKRLFAEA